jgi:quercetin dioxygenase-like cupin family protein
MTNEIQNLSIRLRGMREAADITADAVADATGVDAARYADYEAGRADVPMSYLARLAAFYKVDTTVFLTGSDARAQLYHVTRAGQGPVIERRAAYHYEAIGAGFTGRRMEAYMVTVEADEKPLHENTHPGQELDMVMEGRVLVRVAGHDIELAAGDSIYFDATQPHGMKALDGKPARFLAVING